MDHSVSLMQRHTRPLDFVLWEHSRGHDRRAAVLDILAAYQNADGGFAPAIEPDDFGAASTPLGAWRATQALRQVGCFDRAVPVVGRTIEHLLATRGADGRWPVPGPEGPERPAGHAGRHDPDEPRRLAVVAGLLGFLLRAGVDVRRDVLAVADECLPREAPFAIEPAAGAVLLGDLAAAGLTHSARAPEQVVRRLDSARRRDPAAPRVRPGRPRTARAAEASLGAPVAVPVGGSARSHLGFVAT